MFAPWLSSVDSRQLDCGSALPACALPHELRMPTWAGRQAGLGGVDIVAGCGHSQALVGVLAVRQEEVYQHWRHAGTRLGGSHPIASRPMECNVRRRTWTLTACCATASIWRGAWTCSSCCAAVRSSACLPGSPGRTALRLRVSNRGFCICCFWRCVACFGGVIRIFATSMA